MQDRFNFQAILKNEKTLREVEGVCFTHKKVLINIASFLEWHEFKVLRQCTGLKDKNGKLEYQGDILLTPDGSICFIVNDDFRWAVESPGSHAVDYEDAKFFEQCEVIGNIYENKELLEGRG